MLYWYNIVYIMIWFDFWSKEPAVVQMCTAAVNMRTFAVLPASGLACISLKGTSRPTSLQSKSRTNISVSSFNVWFILLSVFSSCWAILLILETEHRSNYQWKQGHMNSPRAHHPVSVLETKIRANRNTFTCSDNKDRTFEHEYIQFQCFSFLYAHF